MGLTVLLLWAAAAQAEGTEKFGAPILAEQQGSLADKETGFRTKLGDDRTQGSGASEIGLPAGGGMDERTRAELQALRQNQHTTPKMRALIDQLLQGNPDGAHQRAGAAGELGYRQHGYANTHPRRAAETKSTQRPDPRRRRKAVAAAAPNDGLRFETLRSRQPIDLSAPAAASGFGGAAAPVFDSPRGLPAAKPNPFTPRAPTTAPPPEDDAAEDPELRAAARLPAGGEIDAPSRDAWELIAAARRLARAGELDRAEQSARAAIALDPQNALAHLALAKIMLKRGKFEAAVEAATVAISLLRNNAEAYFVRALAYEQLGRPGRKIRDLRIAAAYDPARYERFIKDGAYERTLFDPDEADSFQLFTAPARAAPAAAAPRRWGPALILLALFAVTAAVLIAFGRRRLWAVGAPRYTQLPVELAPRPAAPAPRPRAHSPDDGRWRLRPGIKLAEKYKLVRPLSSDGGETWRAQDKTLDRPAVVQRLFVGPDENETRRERQAAAKKAATLHHPNVTDIFEILDLPSGLYVVYEYTPGLTVRQILNEKEHLPIDQVRDILIPVCRALEHAHHRDVIHGSISPQSITVTKQGYIKVAQFALGPAGGETPYCAPEVRAGKEPRPGADIYALGVCCFEMLNGRLPEDDETPDNRLLKHALHPDVRVRLDSGRKFLSLLREEAASRREPQAGTDTDAEA